MLTGRTYELVIKCHILYIQYKFLIFYWNNYKNRSSSFNYVYEYRMIFFSLSRFLTMWATLPIWNVVSKGVFFFMSCNKVAALHWMLSILQSKSSATNNETKFCASYRWYAYLHTPSRLFWRTQHRREEGTHLHTVPKLHDMLKKRISKLFSYFKVSFLHVQCTVE